MKNKQQEIKGIWETTPALDADARLLRAFEMLLRDQGDLESPFDKNAGKPNDEDTTAN